MDSVHRPVYGRRAEWARIGVSGLKATGLVRGCHRAAVRVSLGLVVACAALAFSLGGGVASSSGVARVATASGQTSGPIMFLQAVSCSSLRTCIAIGTLSPNFADFENGQVSVPVADRWNGRAWSIESMPAPPNSSRPVLRLSCPSSRTCFAVGDIDVPQEILVERWNGSRWAIQPTPDPTEGLPGSASLNDVSCTSPNACTAVGSSRNGPLVERWNGKQWSIQPTIGPAGGVFENVSCASKRACMAVGSVGSSAFAEGWNGATWAREPIPSNGYFGAKYGIPDAAGACSPASGVDPRSRASPSVIGRASATRFGRATPVTAPTAG